MCCWLCLCIFFFCFIATTRFTSSSIAKSFRVRSRSIIHLSQCENLWCGSYLNASIPAKEYNQPTSRRKPRGNNPTLIIVKIIEWYSLYAFHSFCFLFFHYNKAETATCNSIPPAEISIWTVIFLMADLCSVANRERPIRTLHPPKRKNPVQHNVHIICNAMLRTRITLVSKKEA